MKLRALDLFCGAGGATRGLQIAGFHVTGVDIAPQPNYCGDEFIRHDAFHVAEVTPLQQFDLIWASPPCQGRTAYKRRPGHVRDVDTDGAIKRIRHALRDLRRAPYIIENVPGAPLESPIMLCGSMFGLDVRRHRIFETSFDAGLQPACEHHLQQGDFPQATNRRNGARPVRSACGVFRSAFNEGQWASSGWNLKNSVKRSRRPTRSFSQNDSLPRITVRSTSEYPHWVKEDAMANTNPALGMPCTVCYLTDRHAATVIAVSLTGRKVTVREDRAIRTDSNGMSDQQAYRYLEDPNGQVHVFYRDASGHYKARGRYLTLGQRSSYHDYSF